MPTPLRPAESQKICRCRNQAQACAWRKSPGSPAVWRTNPADQRGDHVVLEQHDRIAPPTISVVGGMAGVSLTPSPAPTNQGISTYPTAAPVARRHLNDVARLRTGSVGLHGRCALKVGIGVGQTPIPGATNRNRKAAIRRVPECGHRRDQRVRDGIWWGHHRVGNVGRGIVMWGPICTVFAGASLPSGTGMILPTSIQ